MGVIRHGLGHPMRQGAVPRVREEDFLLHDRKLLPPQFLIRQNFSNRHGPMLGAWRAGVKQPGGFAMVKWEAPDLEAKLSLGEVGDRGRNRWRSGPAGRTNGQLPGPRLKSCSAA